MAFEDLKDAFKNFTCKKMGISPGENGHPFDKQEFLKKFRQIPFERFLPRRSFSSIIKLYGPFFLGGFFGGAKVEFMLNNT